MPWGGQTFAGSQQGVPSALARRPVTAQPVIVSFSQVVGKKIITRSTGKDLGGVTTLWVDPGRGEVVSLDIEDKKSSSSSLPSTLGGVSPAGGLGGGGTRVSNVHLARLVQIGDVVLVQDEQVLYDQPLDGRYGFVVLPGKEIRTRGGDFLGKIRDFTFSPDNGALAKLTYDDYGLPFLPAAFFDTFSVSMGDVLGIGPGGIIVSDEAKYRERRESNGMFAVIPQLLRSIGSGAGGAGQGVAGLLAAPGGSSSSQDPYLPQGYTYNQWEMDVRRWEQETGLSYDQYTRDQQQQERTAARQQLAAPQMQREGGGGGMGGTYGPSPSSQPQLPQQQYPGRLPQQQRPQLQQPQQQQQRFGGMPPSQMQPPQQQQAGGLGGAGSLPSMGRPQQFRGQQQQQQQASPSSQQGASGWQPQQQQPGRQPADPRYRPRGPQTGPYPSPGSSPAYSYSPPQQQQQQRPMDSQRQQPPQTQRQPAYQRGQAGQAASDATAPSNGGVRGAGAPSLGSAAAEPGASSAPGGWPAAGAPQASGAEAGSQSLSPSPGTGGGEGGAWNGY